MKRDSSKDPEASVEAVGRGCWKRAAGKSKREEAKARLWGACHE